MAVAELIVSRRALLGAACAVPLARHPGFDPGSPFSSPAPQDRGIPDPPGLIRGRNDERGDDQSFAVTKWDRALATFRRAEAAVNAAEGEPDEDRYDALLGAFNNALRHLLRAPAPDLRALSLKIDLAVDHEIAELTGGDRCLAVLKADARRLAG